MHTIKIVWYFIIVYKSKILIFKEKIFLDFIYIYIMK